MGWLHLGLVAVGLLAGCSDNGSPEETITGAVALPLVTYGPSGATYRLRNAVFELTPYQYYWSSTGTGGAYGTSVAMPPTTSIETGTATGTSIETGTATGTSIVTGTATGTSIGTSPAAVVVNSEDQPDAESITVDLEQGQYLARLLPGWTMEKTVDGTTEPVEAQLLNGNTQWFWVSPHATSWLSYQFGIGNRALWFNGDVNINIQVFESPDQYYGGVGGATGVYPGTGGATTVIPGSGGAPSTSPGTWVGAGGVMSID